MQHLQYWAHFKHVQQLKHTNYFRPQELDAR